MSHSPNKLEGLPESQGFRTTSYPVKLHRVARSCRKPRILCVSQSLWLALAIPRYLVTLPGHVPDPGLAVRNVCRSLVVTPLLPRPESWVSLRGFL